MRPWKLLIAVLALGLVTGACASSKDTGFPQGVTRDAKSVDCGDASDEAAPYEGPVFIGDNCYVQKTITVASGTTVEWEQIGVAPHNVVATDGSFDSSPDCGSDPATCLGAGDTYEHLFETPGTFAYYCVIHGNAQGAGMAGTVIVEG